MKLTSEATQIALIGIFLGFIGFISSVSDIFANFGLVGGAISILLTVILLIVSYRALRPILIKNKRNVTLLEAIEVTGLVDIESRNDRDHPLPPEEFFRAANDEIVITGLSLFRTFDQNLDIIREALDAGKDVYVLMMHPDSPYVPMLSGRENLSMQNTINETINIIRKNQLDKHAGFRIRFMQNPPPFTAVLIDGNILQTGKKARDEYGQIRVQPITLHQTQNTGIILQFRRISTSVKGGFDYFAEDLRKQWQKDGKEAPELFIEKVLENNN